MQRQIGLAFRVGSFLGTGPRRVGGPRPAVAGGRAPADGLVDQVNGQGTLHILSVTSGGATATTGGIQVGSTAGRQGPGGGSQRTQQF